MVLAPGLLPVEPEFTHHRSMPQVERHGTTVRAGGNPGGAALLGRFVPNVGQFGNGVAFAASGASQAAFVTADGDLVQAFRSTARKGAGSETGWTIRERFSLRADGHPDAVDSDGSNITYVSRGGSRSTAGFKRIHEEKIAPGISLDLKIDDGRIERLFMLAPGSRVADLDVATSGSDGLEVGGDGGLLFRHADKPVRLSAPRAFQWMNGEKREIAVSYRVSGTHYGFELGPHNPALPVVIDPVMQSTYYGGSYIDLATSMAVDPNSGDIYLAGSTQSADLAGSVGGAMQGHFALSGFVARFSGDLTKLYQATYIDGITGAAYDVAINHKTGDIYVGGATGDTLIPDTAGGANSAAAGQIDTSGYGYILRLNHALTSLVQATYFSANVSGLDINQTTGDVYAAGPASNDPFPAGVPSAYPALPGDNPMVVARISADLTRFLGYSYLGGTSNVPQARLALDQSSGRVFVLGITTSKSLPGTAGAFQPALNGLYDTFVAAFNPDLGTLVRATYLGGSGDESQFLNFDLGGEYAFAIAVSPKTGEPYVVGDTDSTDFPGTKGGAVSQAPGGMDGFVAHLSSDLTQLLGASYMGGTEDDGMAAVAVAPDTGDVYAAGYAQSKQIPGTTGGAIDARNSYNVSEAFAVRFDASLATLKQSTWYGVGWTTEPYAIAFDPQAGSVYLAGLTEDSALPNTDGAAIPQTLDSNSTAGYFDGFITRINTALTAAAVHTSPDDFQFNTQVGAPQGTLQNSNVVEMTGIDGLVPVHVSGGAYSVDGGAFTTADGQIGLRQHLQLQLAAASAPATATSMSASVGTITRTFSVSTDTGTNTVPNPYTFAELDNVAPGTSVVSTPVRIDGLTAQSPISVSGGQYSIDGSAFTSSAGMIHGGQTVSLMQTSAADFSSKQQSTLTVGGVSAIFTSVTEAKDIDPDPLNFGSATVGPGTTGESGYVRITGINAPAPVSIENGQYAILEQGNQYTSAAGSITLGQHITVEQVAPSTFSSTGTTTVRVGGTTGTFVVTTPAEDDTPDPFPFTDVTNAELDTVYQPTVLPAGFNATIPVTISGAGAYAFSLNGPFTTAAGQISPGQVLYLQISSAGTYSTTVQTTLTLGTVSETLKITTKPQPSGSSSSGGSSSSSSSSGSRNSGGSGGGGGSFAPGIVFLLALAAVRRGLGRRRRRVA